MQYLTSAHFSNPATGGAGGQQNRCPIPSSAASVWEPQRGRRPHVSYTSAGRAAAALRPECPGRVKAPRRTKQRHLRPARARSTIANKQTRKRWSLLLPTCILLYAHHQLRQGATWSERDFTRLQSERRGADGHFSRVRDRHLRRVEELRAESPADIEAAHLGGTRCTNVVAEKRGEVSGVGPGAPLVSESCRVTEARLADDHTPCA